MKHLNLESGTFFKMGDGKNWRVISPEMGAKQITLNYAIHAPGQEFPQHLHDDSEDIFVCLRGKTSVREGDQYYPMNPGDAVWIPAGDVHGSKNQFSEPAELFSFQSPPDMPLYHGQTARLDPAPGRAFQPPAGPQKPHLRPPDGGRRGGCIQARRLAAASSVAAPGAKRSPWITSRSAPARRFHSQPNRASAYWSCCKGVRKW